MKATISEIVPERLNVSYVAFSFDPPPSGLVHLALLQSITATDLKWFSSVPSRRASWIAD
jgi:hypothetical protein